MSAGAAAPRQGSVFRVCTLFVVYGLVHSLLASRPVKDWVERRAGRRVRHGLYRPFFILQSLVTTVWTLKKFGDLPDRTLYQVPKPWSWAWQAVQAFAVALLLRALAVVGYLRLLGVPQLVAFLRGREPKPVPEAQGPPPDVHGQPVLAGPFRAIRHPDNLFFALFLWGLPRMSVNRLTLALLSTGYAVLGSWHEDARLRMAYGAPFARYQQATPLFVPRLPTRETARGSLGKRR